MLDTLDRLKLAENTLVIFTSDNGPVVDDGYKDDAVEKLGDHKPAGPLRGGKYSIFEGGTRVPFIVRWPGRVKPGVTDALVCQVDFPRLLRRADRPEPRRRRRARQLQRPARAAGRVARPAATHWSKPPGGLALRSGTWKYIEPGQGPRRTTRHRTPKSATPPPRNLRPCE